MSPNLLPKSIILLNSHLRRVLINELTQSAEIHWLREEGDDVFVKGLPVRVVEVVLLGLFVCVSVFWGL